MVNCRLHNLILSLLGLTVIISPGYVWGQKDENGIFISCGGPGFTDKDGNEWLADTDVPGYTPVGGRHINKNADIIGSAYKSLYQSERFHNSFRNVMEMDIEVPPGLYEVKLHFAEIFPGAQAVNKRIFDVIVQDVLVYNELDIYALVGADTALTINAATRVDEGDELRIVLKRIKQNPKISGIEIRPIVEALEEFNPIYINCGGDDYTDSLGRVWAADKYFDENLSPSWRTKRTRNIKETEDNELYRTERYSTAMVNYEIPVPNGVYKAKLHFAEVYYTKSNSKGKRVFDIEMGDDALAYEGLDIYDTAGPFTAMQLDLPAFVNDGFLSIKLLPIKNDNGNPVRWMYPKISAIEVHEIKEVYQWNTYGRSGLTLVVMDALDDQWTGIFGNAVASWSAGPPSKTDRPLNLLKIEVPHDPDCVAVPGRIKVCNGDYGDTKWVGLNTVTLQDGYVKNSVARMNDFYLRRSNKDQQIYAMCHEMGHACGLPHTDEDYFNEDTGGGDCLDYTVRPEKNKKPGKFNFKLLEQLYGKLDNNRRLAINGRDREQEPEEDTPEDGALEDEIPEDVQEQFDNFVMALETISCREWDRTAPPGQQVTHLEENDSEESCEIEAEGGYSIRIRKLLAKNWDLYD